MPKSSNVTPPKKAAPAAVPQKTQRIHNVSGSGFEVILLIDGLWEHFWLNPGDAISVPKVPLSLTANTLLQNKLIEIGIEN
tara:strand:+ start:313 stop:555 length:243 start_codon:yes stop_codon:yes gene_type:complete